MPRADSGPTDGGTCAERLRRVSLGGYEGGRNGEHVYHMFNRRMSQTEWDWARVCSPPQEGWHSRATDLLVNPRPQELWWSVVAVNLKDLESSRDKPGGMSTRDFPGYVG